ncbi:hypothetical protein DY000_02041200 [Brassica cretica]|uniref:Uncharacterized protein n=1 Tax=Brassica cretica TaxID=69181 RepID=A0ABQ7B5V1_BRACR|nr:hypothetical protein DY000_02041200 [Brassica cretica]
MGSSLQENSDILTDIPTENEILGISRGISEEIPRKHKIWFPRNFLGINRRNSEETSIRRNIPRKYPDDVLPRYIPRTFPTNEWSSEFPRKFVSSEFRRKIPRDFRGKKKFRGIISDDLFRRYVIGITVFRRNSDDFFPQNPCCFLVVHIRVDDRMGSSPPPKVEPVSMTIHIQFGPAVSRTNLVTCT